MTSPKPAAGLTGTLHPGTSEAEAAVLGAILLEKDALFRVSHLLKSGMFADNRHDLIYSACLELYRENAGIDMLTVKAQLAKAGKLKEAGGPVYLTKLTTRVASSANIEFHAGLIAEAYLKRQAGIIAANLFAQAQSPEVDPFNLLSSAQIELMQLASGLDTKRGRSMQAISEAFFEQIRAAMETEGGMIGISSGIPKIDNFTRGFRGSELILVAARPSMGKSDFAVWIATYAAMTGTNAAFFSLELPDTQIYGRQMSMLTGMNKAVFHNANPDALLSGDDFRPDVLRAASKLNSLPLKIVAAGGISGNMIRQRILEYNREGVTLIVVDYLGLVRLEKERGENDAKTIGRFTKMLKQTANELDITIILLHQLNRGVESRTDKRPVLSDLRDSGEIEEDADRVIMLYRGSYYGEEVDEEGNITVTRDERGNLTSCQLEVIFRKNRNGPLGTALLNYQISTGRFADWEQIGGEAAPF